MPSVSAMEDRRKRLLKAVIAYTEGQALPKGFMADFFRYAKDVDFNLIQSGQDYFALFIRDMVKAVDFQLAWPLATTAEEAGYRLAYNPISFLFLSQQEAQALIQHEVYHLILDHPARARALKKRYASLAVDLAMDIAVNQYIQFLPGFAQKLNSVNLMLDLEMEYNQPLEVYAREIDKALKKNSVKKDAFNKEPAIDYQRVHEDWAKGQALSQEDRQSRLKAMHHQGEKGGLPKEIMALLPQTGKAQISWQRALKIALTSLPAGRRKTIMRRNRRQPHRPELKGELPNRIPQVIVAIDVSASIENEDLRSYIREILAMVASYGESLRIIECDDHIRRDYQIQAPSDLKPPLERRGGTAFSPVFERLRQEGNHQALLVYFTDGEGEAALSLKPRHQVHWIVTGQALSLKESYGPIHYIRKDQGPQEKVYGLDVMRELLHEWAR